MRRHLLRGLVVDMALSDVRAANVKLSSFQHRSNNFKQKPGDYREVDSVGNVAVRRADGKLIATFDAEEFETLMRQYGG